MHYYTFTSTSKPTVGDTKLSLVGADHMGWLICDGRTLNIKDFYYLHQVIGTTYGSTASTTFNLPNPAGTVLGVIGSGLGSNGLPLTTRTAGQLVGEENHTLTIAEMPTHNHPGSSNMPNTTGVTDSGHSHSYTATNDTNHDNAVSLTNSPNNQGTRAATTGTSSANIVDPSHNHTLVMSNQGGSNAHNNMQPTLFIGNMFIYCGKPSVGTYAFSGNGIY
jgi:microcystin-dependent protein